MECLYTNSTQNDAQSLLTPLQVREFISDYMSRVQAWWVDHKYKLKHEALRARGRDEAQRTLTV